MTSTSNRKQQQHKCTNLKTVVLTNRETMNIGLTHLCDRRAHGISHSSAQLLGSWRAHQPWRASEKPTEPDPQVEFSSPLASPVGLSHHRWYAQFGAPVKHQYVKHTLKLCVTVWVGASSHADVANDMSLDFGSVVASLVGDAAPFFIITMIRIISGSEG